MSLGNYKLKQCDTTAQLLDWLKSKVLTALKADKDVKQQEPSLD